MWILTGMFDSFSVWSRPSRTEVPRGSDHLFFVELRTIVAQPPRSQLPRLAVAHRHDHIRERRPRVIEVVLRRLRGMIRMRMIEPEQLAAASRLRALPRRDSPEAARETGAAGLLRSCWAARRIPRPCRRGRSARRSTRSDTFRAVIANRPSMTASFNVIRHQPASFQKLSDR